jgi:dihydroneopterin aldolase
MDQIILADLEVRYRVGVTEAERAQPQRLLLTVEMSHDLRRAVVSDDLTDTIDYAELSRRLLQWGNAREWRLIETLATDIARLVLDEFRPQTVTVSVKKFIIPQARYVAVRVARSA